MSLLSAGKNRRADRSVGLHKLLGGTLSFDIYQMSTSPVGVVGFQGQNGSLKPET